jgi:hypothetical protein
VLRAAVLRAAGRAASDVMKRFLFLFSLLALPVATALAQTPITFPVDGGIVDVRNYGATPDDESDDTAAIQGALDAFPNGNRIVYLPPGVFIVRDTLSWPAGENGSVAQKRTILQGAGESLTTLQLPASTGGFTDGGKPKALIWTGTAPAQRFRNAVRDLTIEVGPKNHGAIGLQFHANNQGCLRNLTIRSLEGSGKIGLDLGHSDEIGPLLGKNITVEGFEIGISTKWPVNSNTFENITLINQRRIGWWNYHQMIFVRNLVSENRVPSIFNEKDSWGSVTLLDAHLHAFLRKHALVLQGLPQVIHENVPGTGPQDETGHGLVDVEGLNVLMRDPQVELDWRQGCGCGVGKVQEVEVASGGEEGQEVLVSEELQPVDAPTAGGETVQRSFLGGQ